MKEFLEVPPARSDQQAPRTTPLARCPIRPAAPPAAIGQERQATQEHDHAIRPSNRRQFAPVTTSAPGSRRWNRHIPPLHLFLRPAIARKADGRRGERVVRSARARSCGRSSRRRSHAPRRSARSTGRAQQPRHRSRSRPQAAFDGRLATREPCCVQGCGDCDSSDDVRGGPGVRPEVLGRPGCRMPPIATRGRGGRMRDERVGGGALRSTQREDPAIDSPRAVSHPRPDEIRSRIPTLLGGLEMTSVHPSAHS